MNIDLHFKWYRKECLIFWEVIQIRQIQCCHLSHVQIDNVQPKKNWYCWDPYNGRVYPFPSIWIMFLKSINYEAKIIDHSRYERIFILFTLFLLNIRFTLWTSFLSLCKKFYFDDMLLMSFLLLFYLLKNVWKF